MRFATVFVTTLIVCFAAYGQKQNNNWCFGRNAGVSFNSTPPSTFIPTVESHEGVASVSHRNTGALLFYADNSKVYNRNFNVMPNGVRIGTNANGTTAQGVNIAPFVNDSNRYYLFTLRPQSANGRLSYSVIDMRLDGGLGDVVAGQKFLPIDSNFTEAMTIAEGCKSYWLLAYKRGTAEFYAYNITAGGINTTPVISTTGYTNRSLDIATMKVSPDGKHLCVASYNGTPGSFLALHDFNAATGQISSGDIIDTRNGVEFYTSEFSPNSTQLYVSAYASRGVYQYDITLPTPAAITASKRAVVLSLGGGIAGALQMGPDSNIYLATGLSIGRISNANARAPNCIYTPNLISIASPNRVNLGLPQAVVNVVGVGKGIGVDFSTRRDTSVCLRLPHTLLGRAGAKSYLWNDGSTQSSLSVTNEGTYWVRSPDTCGFITDTIVVKNSRDTSSIAHEEIMCDGGKLVLKSNRKTPTSAHYWNTGSTNDSITISSAGRYWVSTTELCTVVVDSFDVNAIEVKATITGEDTSICVGDSILLTGIVTPSTATYKWNNSDTLPTTKGSIGKYILTASFMDCEATDERTINPYPIVSIELGESREICKDDVLVLPEIVTSEQGDVYQWQDGSTGRTFNVKEAGLYYVQLSNVCYTVSDTITITTRNCRLFFPSAFTPNADGRNDIARLVGDIAHVKEYTLRIINRWGEVVFFTETVREGWDGNYKNIPAELGTYYYLIEFKYLGNKELMKGSIMLLR